MRKEKGQSAYRILHYTEITMADPGAFCGQYEPLIDKPYRRDTYSRGLVKHKSMSTLPCDNPQLDTLPLRRMYKTSRWLTGC